MQDPMARMQQIDGDKRATLRKLAAGAAFAAPVVLSFSLGSLAITDVRAYVNPGGGGDTGTVPLPGQNDTTTGRSTRSPVKPIGQK